jgi:hypothetical protein
MNEVYFIWAGLVGLLLFCALAVAGLNAITPRRRK